MEALEPSQPPDLTTSSELVGRVVWRHTGGERSAFLTEETMGAARRQRLYTVQQGELGEVHIQRGHIVVRPKWVGDRLIYERWNPWAIPPLQKLRRYVASWVDPSLRPEVALYESDRNVEEWRFLMPGHSLAVAPDGRQTAFLRSGALLAGYFSIHTWRVGSAAAPVVISLREHADKATKSFVLQWSRDSLALRMYGKTAGFERRASQTSGTDGTPVDLLYLVSTQALYDLTMQE